MLATSRSPRGLRPVQEALGLHDEWFVCFQGALVAQWRGDTLVTLSETTLTSSTARAVEQEALRRGLSVGRYSTLDWLVDRVDAEVARQVAITGELPRRFSENRSLLAPPAHKVLVTSLDPARCNELDGLARALPPEVAAAYSHRNMLEITAAGVSKGAALERLSTHLGLSLAGFAAIGDALNDLTMLRAVGCPVAMGQAPVEVRETAVLVTATNAEDGVARALGALGLCAPSTRSRPRGQPRREQPT